MTQADFHTLDCGDYATIKRGASEGILVQIVYIEDERNICVRIADSQRYFPETCSGRTKQNLKIMSAVDLLLV